ncbi:ferritin [Corynebacterium diphtheriae]|nr:ferritin [Corynebacterium diphtheriae]
MSINEKLAAALNDQITAELEASMVYLQLSYILDDLSLTGMSSWMKKQHKEELDHAAAFSTHLLNRDYRPQIGDIAPPKLDAATAIEAFEASLAHEQKITGMIRELADLSMSVKDHDSRPLIDSFLQEQIDEEATVKEILDRLRMADTGTGLLRMDAELGER